MTRGERRHWSTLAPVAAVLASLAGPAGDSAATPSVTATTRAWLSSRIGRGIGPPGGEVRALVIAPSKGTRLYAGATSGQLFVTDDGAESWRSCEARLPPDTVLSRLAVDPRSPDVAYAAYWFAGGGGGLLQTGDGGTRWDPLPVPGNPALRTIALSPSEPDTAYVGGKAGVWRSHDGGRTWAEASGGSARIREVESLAVDSAIPLLVYAGTWRQAYRSLDGGASWSRIGSGMDLDRDVFAIATCTASPSLLIAGTCGFLYRSDDGGDSWAVRGRGLPFHHRRVQSVAIGGLGSSEVWAGTRGGLYRSRDGAGSFALVVAGVSVSSLVLDTKLDRVYAATEELGVLAAEARGPFAERNAGLDATRVVAFEAMPSDLHTLFAARSEGPGVQSIQTSRDAGRTWSSLGPDLRFENVRFLRASAGATPQLLVIGGDGRWQRLTSGQRLQRFPAPPGRLAAVAIAHAAAVVFAATDEGLFFLPLRLAAVTDTGGSTGWRRIATTPLTALAVNGDRLVALGPEGAVGGRVAAMLAGRPPERTAGHLPFDPVGLALSPDLERPAGGAVRDGRPTIECSSNGRADRPCDDSVAYAVTDDGMWLGARGGLAGWTELALPWPGRGFRAVEVDPSRPDRVIALDSRGTLFCGEDRGTHWRVVDTDAGLDPAQDFRMSATIPGLALVATIGHGIRVVSLAGSAPRDRSPPEPAADDESYRPLATPADLLGQDGLSAESSSPPRPTAHRPLRSPGSRSPRAP